MVTLSAGHEIAYETFERLGFKKAWLDVLYSEALARLDLVITPSKFEAHRTAKQFGLKGNRLRVIYNGIDVRRARRMASNASPTRSFLSKLGLKKKGYVLYVGRLDSDKGIHILPFLACTIAEPILVAGEHMYDSPYGEVIFKKIISYYDLGGRLIPIGYVSENSKFALMANALATVYPSTNAESFGLVPIESVAVGTPALLPGLGPFPEIAKKIGDMCQLYRPFDVSLLAKALSRVRGQDLTQAKEKAVVAIQENFDSRRMAERVASTMRNLV
jgi:glycosyltransferase involved in cell wall biosynthesis